MGILARLIRRPLLSPITHIFSPWMKEELVRANGRSPIIMNKAALKMIVEEYALEKKKYSGSQLQTCSFVLLFSRSHASTVL